MDLSSLKIIGEIATTSKSVFEAVSTATTLLKNVASSISLSPKQETEINDAINNAERTAALLDAQVAQALNYTLCRCEFPPTIMLKVGYLTRAKEGVDNSVYKCPKCETDTAAPYNYTPIKKKEV